MKRFNLGLILGVALITSFFTMASFRFFSNGKLLSFEKSTETLSEPLSIPAPSASPVGGGGIPFDFTEAAEKTTDAVVHIKTKINPKPVANRGRGSNPYQDLFGDDFFRLFGDPYGGGMMPNQPQEASGSGVIIDAGGYIVTNNHVVEDADEITVTLHNNKTYTAKLIGKDKDFDLAVIKIEETKLPTVEFGNSDSVKVGQWCVAVGNPFNLTSTVTAGIVSAKGRNINLLGGGNAKGGNTAIESFIQTDAAVNPGNSGGALVNLKGQLIGINTAIASNTGSYAGYSFAVPSNLVYKVYTDIKNFGTVQRGYLGVTIRSVDDALAKELKLNSVEGVYVESLVDESAATDAGIKPKDVITKINGVGIKTSPELQEQVGKYRPGDKINVEYIRDGKVLSTIVTLKNKFNNTSTVDNGKEVLNLLGADFTALTPQEAAKLGVKGGVKVSNVKEGKLKQYTEIQNGFIITFLNEQAITSTDDMVNAIGGKTGNITIEGVYPGKPFSFLYAFKM